MGYWLETLGSSPSAAPLDCAHLESCRCLLLPAVACCPCRHQGLRSRSVPVTVHIRKEEAVTGPDLDATLAGGWPEPHRNQASSVGRMLPNMRFDRVPSSDRRGLSLRS
ncbi:unnamed protein product [Arctogadus glacialis]